MRWLSALFVLAAPSFGADCHATKFETELIKEACADGGQKAARDAMKRFQKKLRDEHPDLDCRTCHKALAPDFPTKSDALDRFKRLGGK